MANWEHKLNGIREKTDWEETAGRYWDGSKEQIIFSSQAIDEVGVVLEGERLRKNG
jgi:hypothetical protein